MKRNILLSFAFLLTASVQAHQVKILSGKIIEKDSSVTIRFAVTPGPLASNERLTLTPVLYSASGTRELRPIVIVGRNRAISDQRIGEVPGLRYIKEQVISYADTLPYESWMAEVSLRLDRRLMSCCSEQRFVFQSALPSRLIHYDVQPSYQSEHAIKATTELERHDSITDFLHPISEYKVRRETIKTLREDGALKAYFKQGSSIINPEIGNNRDVLARLHKVLTLIAADSTAVLEKVVVLGLSSPEGDRLQNAKLAARRAESVKSYMKRSLKENTDSIFELIITDEDWDGLVKLVEASDMQYKQEVLDIIKTYDVLDGRNKRLMRLMGGRPYRYLLEHFFPQLRNAGYVQIYYSSKPDMSVVTLNRALDLIQGKQYGEALGLLITLKGDARVDNLCGVALMMMGDYTQAEVYLQRAVAQGSQDAVKNLQEILIRQSIDQ